MIEISSRVKPEPNPGSSCAISSSSSSSRANANASSKRRARLWRAVPMISVVIDAALAHLVESEENIREGGDEYEPVTIQQLCNTSVLGLQYRTRIKYRWR